MNIDEIKRLIPLCTTRQEVLISLGINPNNSTKTRQLRKIIKENNLDVSHLRTIRSSIWADNYKIIDCYNKSDCITTFLNLMGLDNIGGNYKSAKRHILRLGLDLNKINGKNNAKIIRSIRNKENPKGIKLEDILNGQYPHYKSSVLKKRLIKEEYLKEICSSCGLGNKWNNIPIILQLDHKDGNSKNNKLDNLRILCPNCHSLTDSYKGKNKGKGRKSRYIKTGSYS